MNHIQNSSASNYISSEDSDDSSSQNSLSISSPIIKKSHQTGLPLRSQSPILSAFHPYTKQDLSSIFVLPPEILILIFSFFKEKSDLVSLLPVCKYWAQLLVELIWFRPKLQSKKAYKQIQVILDADPLSTFVNYRLFVRRLNVCFIASYVDDDFLLKFQNCLNLERLTLVNCSKLTSSSISKVLKDCSKLQSIDMSGVKNISDEIFDALAANCPRLQGVYAPDAGNVSNDSVINLFQHCPYLKRIKLTKSQNVNDSAIQELSKNFKYVVEIDLHGCPNVTDLSLTHVFNNLEQLREFRISQNKNISDNIFKSLPDIQFLNRLRILDFTDCSYITDRSIEKIVRCAPRLRNVVLSKCLNITDASLRALAQLNKSLHYIHLGHCSNITDFGVKLLVSNCYRLQYIDLACCTQLTNASVVELANLPRLKRIGLVKCVHITDQGVLQLVQKRGPGDTLERVHLSYCTQLSTHPIYLLLKCCPKLTHLSLTGIQAFLRPDFKRFCRDPPEEFTAHQRQLFCVFSGPGVKNLRDYLATIFPSEEQQAYGLPPAFNVPPEMYQNRILTALPDLQQRQAQQIQLVQQQRRLFDRNHAENPSAFQGVFQNELAQHLQQERELIQQRQQQLQQRQQQPLSALTRSSVFWEEHVNSFHNADGSVNGPNFVALGAADIRDRQRLTNHFQWDNAFTQSSTPVPENLVVPASPWGGVRNPDANNDGSAEAGDVSMSDEID